MSSSDGYRRPDVLDVLNQAMKLCAFASFVEGKDEVHVFLDDVNGYLRFLKGQERRCMPQSRWLHRIDIKQHLDSFNDDQSNVEAQTRVIEGVMSELKKLPEPLASELNNLNYFDIGKSDCVEMFDESLEDLYDWADENRIWLGI